MRVAQHVFGAVDAAGGYLGFIQMLNHLVERQRIDPAINHAVQLVAASVTPVIAGQCWVVRQVVTADHLHEALEDRIAIGADLHMLAVCGGVDRGRGDAGHDVAGALTDKPEHIELGDHAFHHGEDGFIQRHIHHLAQAAVDFAVTQRHQRADHCPQRGNRVADGDTGAHGRAVLEAGDIAQAAHGLAHRAKPRLVLHRARLAEAREAHHHQLGVEGVQGFPAQAEFLQHAWAEVFDQDVGVGQQLLEDRQPLRVLEVEGQRLLVARLHEPPQRSAFIQLAPFAQRVAAVRGFDLDHLGAEFSADA